MPPVQVQKVEADLIDHTIDTLSVIKLREVFKTICKTCPEGKKNARKNCYLLRSKMQSPCPLPAKTDRRLQTRRPRTRPLSNPCHGMPFARTAKRSSTWPRIRVLTVNTILVKFHHKHDSSFSSAIVPRLIIGQWKINLMRASTNRIPRVLPIRTRWKRVKTFQMLSTLNAVDEIDWRSLVLLDGITNWMKRSHVRELVGYGI